MSNISSNPEKVIYSLHYVDNINKDNESFDLENITFFNIKDNKINFITDKTFTNTDNRNLLAFDTNGNIIYQYPDELGLKSCNIDKSIDITLINTCRLLQCRKRPRHCSSCTKRKRRKFMYI